MEGRLPAMLRLETLVVVEDPCGPADVSDALLHEFVFERTPRPGQGSLTGERTNVCSWC